MEQSNHNDKEALQQMIRPDPLDDTKISDLINSFLDTTHSLQLLSEYEFNLAVQNFVEKDDKHAISE
jgi:hypothetical protein